MLVVFLIGPLAYHSLMTNMEAKYLANRPITDVKSFKIRLPFARSSQACIQNIKANNPHTLLQFSRI